MSVWIFVLWVLLPGQTVPTTITGQGVDKAACEAKLTAHLLGQAKLVDVSECVKITPWLHVMEPAASSTSESAAPRRPRVKQAPTQP